MSTTLEPSSLPTHRATPLAYSPADSPASAPTGFLIVEQDNHRQAGPIQGRVLIGRRASNHIVIPDRGVARIHAWITQSDGQYILCDTGSASGTKINKRPVNSRQALKDGDIIRIGPVTIHYRTDPGAIAGAEPIDLTDRPVATNRPDDGQFVDCACGAPLWVPWDFAGKMGQCRYCGQTVFVQTKLSVVPAPVAQPRATPQAYSPVDSSPFIPPSVATPMTAAKLVCGICQSPLLENEPQHACPSCAIPFHTDCWTENRGCSSYGCSQVNILHGAKDQEPPQSGGLMDHGAAADDFAAPPAPPLPWEFLILAGAVIGTVLGAWTFGLPALAAAIAAIFGLRKPSHHRAVLLLALAFAAIGTVAGVAISYNWHFALQHATAGAHR
ncbi:MAG TPA: FHA domain-containing protein [Tepidisphaeraceae bacterium]|nr:FHA domain-containing protein [Tepidisphaeraceae bacterium]